MVYSNTLICGNHMQSGSIFAVLTECESWGFYENHKTIKFDGIYDDGSYEEYEYEIFNAFKTEIGNGFDYYRYANIDNADKFNEYLTNIEEYRLIFTDNKYFDSSELLTLSTCSYHVNGGKGRIIVVSYKTELE